ncbi:MAG: hypothetical protein ACKVP2_15390 [Burkholderiales bacterium]
MAELPQARNTPILGDSEFHKAIDDILETASRSVRIFERSLGREYNSPHRVDALRRYLLASRRNRLLIVLHDASTMDRNCPRLLLLLRQYSHAISIHETIASAKAVYDPFVIVDDRHFVHRFHYDEMRGLATLDDPIEAHSLVERFDELWEASLPAASATTLGL